MATFDDIKNLKYHTVPYPLIYSGHGDADLLRLGDNFQPSYPAQAVVGSPEARSAAWAADEQRRKDIRMGPVGNVRPQNGLTFGGVVPPALNKKFMTDTLLPHQKSALDEMNYARRQQLFADGTVHEVDAAITYLKENIVGFFMAAPLDWGKDHKINGNPSKASAGRVDIANASSPAQDGGRST